MKQTILIVVTILIIPFATAQSQWQELLLSADKTYSEIVEAFSIQSADKAYVKGQGAKQFKRWQNFWQDRTMADGSFPDVYKYYKANWNSLTKNNENGNWINIGPFDHETTSSWSSGTGRINVVKVDPNNENIIYVGAPAGGLWRSSDNGVSWNPLTDQLSSIGISDIAIDENNSNIIYLGTGDKDGGNTYSIGLIKSIDAGVTWQMMGPDMGTISKIAIDPYDSEKLWVAAKNGLYVSTDSGLSWDVVISGNVSDVVFKPNSFGSFYYVSGNNCYYTSNNGTSFSISTGLPMASGRMIIAVTPASINIVYALSANTDYSYQGLYRSTDGGMTFTLQNSSNDIFEGSTQSWYNMALVVSNTDPEMLITGALNLWKSNNGGVLFSKLNSWSAPASINYTHADIHFLKYEENVLYCGSDGGVYRSIDNGQAFDDLSSGLAIGQFYSMAITNQDNTIAGGLQDNGSYVGNDTGWKNYVGADGMESGIDPLDSDHVFGMIQYGGLYSSTDGGNSITSHGMATEEGRWVTPMAMNPLGGSLLAGYDELYEFNFETGWDKVSDFDFPDPLKDIEFFKANTNTIFVSTKSQMYKSIDGGVSWVNVIGNFIGDISSIYVHPEDENVLWLTQSDIIAGDKVFQSTDGGIFWENISENLPNIASNVIKYDPVSNGLYVGMDDGVYYRSVENSGWVPFDNNLPNVIVSDIEINEEEKIIQISTFGRGIWQSSLMGVELHNVDIALLEIISPYETVCGSTMNLDFIVKNNGLNEITTFIVEYGLSEENLQTYTWNGILEYGQSTLVEIDNIEIGADDNVVHLNLLTPNQQIDGDRSNNEEDVEFTVNYAGNNSSFILESDCYAAETSWKILDEQGEVLVEELSGTLTNNSDHQYDLCLPYGCYTLIVQDTYGDGLAGSSASCDFDGDYYFIQETDTLAQMDAADFGNTVSHDFCIEPQTNITWQSVPLNMDINCDEVANVVVTGEPLATSTCAGEIEISYVDYEETTYINRYWTVSDECGNVLIHEQIINFLDDIAPAIACPEDLEVISDDPIYIEVPLPDVTDNCGISNLINSYNNSEDASQSYPIGFHEITWSVFDNFGNENSCIHNIIVQEEANGVIDLNGDPEFSVAIYPNPNGGGEFYINILDNNLSYNQLIIRNVIGEVVLIKNNLIFRDKEFLKVDLHRELNKGIYIVELSNRENRLTKKMIVN
ncbi:MAG: photosystem II stability/assembly factor-like uncharacterized protein [Flavobacteriales bacterium]|jgi:photosystem II stability/assembly factor-like uncharacterized protein